MVNQAETNAILGRKCITLSHKELYQHSQSSHFRETAITVPSNDHDVDDVHTQCVYDTLIEIFPDFC